MAKPRGKAKPRPPARRAKPKAKKPAARPAKPKVKAKAKARPAKPKTKPAAPAKPKTKPQTRTASKAKPTARPKTRPKRPAHEPPPSVAPAQPSPAPATPEAELVPSPELAPPPASPTLEWSERPPVLGGGEVVRILDSADPLGSLRAFLDAIPGGATVQHGQIALGSAQLMLLPIAREHRGGPEVKELLDLVLGRWTVFPDRTGFHAQEFLRNAFAAVGNDRERIARLTALVPTDASPELRFNVACALAVAGEREGMLRAVARAVAAGVSASAVRQDADFAAYLEDPGLAAVLDRAAVPVIPLDIHAYVASVRSSLDSAVRTLREYGEVARLEPPTTLDAVVAAETARKIQLPNDYRALLTISDGLVLWDHTFLGTVDFRNDTTLAQSARAYLEQAAHRGHTGIDACVPLANWGQPNDWLLYDPHGPVRGGAPGYVLMLNADECPLDGLVHALDRFERIARDVLGTN